MPKISLDLGAILRPYAAQLGTRHLFIAQDLLKQAGPLLGAALPKGRWHLIADAHTHSVAGQALEASLDSCAIAHTTFIFAAPAPVATVEAVEALRAELGHAAAVVAIGSGTINDIAKMAAFRSGLPYAVVATAPSMNGYTSNIAALLENGVKTTQPCAPPIAVLADVDVLAQAPYRMLAAGLGDLLSKPVSQADWLLAHHLTESPYSSAAGQLIDASAELLKDVPARLPEVAAVGKLTGSLLLSGLAMTLAGTSAPSSGGEHLISHYIDMTHYALGEANDLHGCQVGVGTIATAALYENLLALDPASIDVDACLARHKPWVQQQRVVQERFGTLSDAVLPHAQQGHAEPEQLFQRLSLLKNNWHEIAAELGTILRPAAQIKADLQAAQGPTDFAALGVQPARARRAILHSKDIRARYTILHLLDELGLLESWTDEVLADLDF
jgi:glycerol-1-phosphate dehydrogenase [NAD(P)+]